MSQQYTTFFSIPVSRITFKNLLANIRRHTQKKERVIILPINIHIFVGTKKNPAQNNWYSQASYIFTDGVPLVWLSRLTHNPIPERLSGTNLVHELLNTTQRIFLLGSTQKILDAMQKKYNTRNKRPIVGTFAPTFSHVWKKYELEQIISTIKKAKADIVLVGVGYPKQEEWIFTNYQKIPPAVCIGVGSAFDILSGKTPRAPIFLQKCGLEWLWRVSLEPKRLLFRYIMDAVYFFALIVNSGIQKYKFLTVVFLAAIIAFCAYGVQAKKPIDMPTFRGNAARTGSLPVEILQRHPSWWRIKTTGLLTGDPIVANNILYVSTWEKNTLFAYNEHSGLLLWSFVAQGDLPFSPVIYDHVVYIASVDGNMYALEEKTGKIIWLYTSENHKSFTSHPYITSNKIIIASRDNNIYALDRTNGSLVWKHTTQNMLESSPIEHNGTLYFGGFDGSIYGISRDSGVKIWEYKTKGKILSSPALINNTLVIGSNDSFVYAIDANNKKLIWKTKTNGPIDSTPALTGSYVFINSLAGEVYALDFKTGKIVWKKTIKTGPHAGFATDPNAAYFGSTDGSLYALDPKTGKELWKYTSAQPITSAPTIVGQTIYATSGPYIYALRKKNGRPYIDHSQFKIIVAPQKTKQFEPTEILISHNDFIYENPWSEASVSARFVSSNGEATTVDGFYYDKNRWGIRFVPSTPGVWKWMVYVRPDPSLEHSTSGIVKVEPSDNPGFIRVSKNNPYRFEFSSGNLFHPIGLGNILLDANNNGYPLDDLSTDEKGGYVTIEKYAQVYGKNGAGFNMFRWSVDNASFPMSESDFNPRSHESGRWEHYPARNGRWGDALVKSLHKEGFRVWATLWGFTPNMGMEKDMEFVYDQPSIERYIRYMVARYSAYVDVWELSNEASVTTEWIHYVSSILKRIDPYQHPITISWERPDIETIDITSPHWYETEDLSTSDITTTNKIKEYIKWRKPIVFGEQGNKYINWDEQSGIRMRVRMWTAFFNEAALIFWNSSGTKSYTSQKNANIYIGEAERKYSRVFSDFILQASANISKLPIQTTNAETRAYALQTNTSTLVYIFHFANTQNAATNISFNLPRRASVSWIDPENGAILKTLSLPPGYHSLYSPVFAVDIALKASFIE